ncbi:hypothetical protein CLOSBL3_20563 [Clostridiaceae bacterium BL-3]|nr:hypothetical protein CLOSBL3_20563 [Clostridiaceae bacterium BL-3]
MSRVPSISSASDLNTSHVKVQHTPYIISRFKMFPFKYISC